MGELFGALRVNLAAHSTRCFHEIILAVNAANDGLGIYAYTPVKIMVDKNPHVRMHQDHIL
jgi:hypothetical protein